MDYWLGCRSKISITSLFQIWTCSIPIDFITIFDLNNFTLFICFDTLINPTHNNILSLYFVSIATNVAPLDLQMSTRQLLYFLETLFRVDGEVYCYSRSFLLLIYMYKVHHCPISWKFYSGWGDLRSGWSRKDVKIGLGWGYGGVRVRS